MNLSEEYAEIGARLIRTLPEFEDLKDAPLSIAYLSSDKQKKVSGRLIFGECKKVSPAYEWCCPFEFIKQIVYLIIRFSVNLRNVENQFFRQFI